MSGVTRRLLGGVLAISLFVCTSLSAFSYAEYSNAFPYYNIFNCNIYGQQVYIDNPYSAGSNIGSYPFPSGALTSSSFVVPSSAPSSMPYIRFTTTSENISLSYSDTGQEFFRYFSRPIPEGYYFASALFYSSVPIDFSIARSNVGYVDLGTADMILDHNLVINEIANNATQYKYAYEAQFIFYVPYVNSVRYRLHFDLYFESPILTSSVSEIVFHTGVMSGLYDPEEDLSLFHLIERGFDSIYTFLFTRNEEQESDYIAVTDPSTSEDIQEAQGMIDTVEGFESQLHANITTEFDKIDFTTPTNLAAPVAYIGDKVTRSMNSLGNYQPLIFVPLTLGIMLIMLGRGITALGSMVSASSRAAARNRSEGDDS